MKAKLFSLFALSIFTFVFLISLASAVSLNNITTYTIPASINEGVGSFNIIFDLTNTGVAGDLNFNASTISTGSLTFNDTAIGADTTETITATANFPTTFSGTISGVINVTGTGMTTYKTLPFSVAIISSGLTNAAICAYDDGITTNAGDLDVTIKGIEVKEGFGEDENWLAMDEVEIEIRVENNGDYDIDDITLEWGIADEGLNDWVIEFDEIDEFNLKDGDDEIFTITFILDEDDLDMDLEDIIGNDYNLVVRATGTIDDNDADELDNQETCAADFKDVSIEDSNAVILSNFQLPESVSCGSTVEISADAWNIGDRDEDEVSVTITNKELKLSEDITLGDIDAFDNQKLSFTFTVPSDATEKSYNILFRVYDEDNDLYEVGEDDDPSEFNIELKVEGGCTDSASLVTVKADLVSGGKAGQDLVVKATLTNAGSNSATYTLSASDYGQFASQYDVQPSTLTLAAGKSGEATYTLKVSKDAFGEQMFYLELVSGSQVTRQPVSVTIQKAGLLDSITGSAISGNSLVWGLGLLNVILVIVIIFVAIRVARK